MTSKNPRPASLRGGGRKHFFGAAGSARQEAAPSHEIAQERPQAEPSLYEHRRGFLQAALQIAALLALAPSIASAAPATVASPRMIKLVAFGDSLTAGYLLPAGAA